MEVLPARSVPSSIEGVSVSLETRRWALGQLAAVYAQYARASGLEKAAESPAHRPSLARRYESVDALAGAAIKKAKRELAEAEAGLLPGLTKAAELVAAGFDFGDVETVRLTTIVEVRRAIGVDVGVEKRQEAMDSIRRAE